MDPKWLGVSLVLFQAYLLLRSRAVFNALREAYPDDEFQWRRVWGAYVTGFGLNNVLPAGTGNLFQYVFTRDAIPSATYPVVVVAIASAAVFDGVMSLVVLGLCFTTTRSFPHLAQIAGLSSFDIGLYLTRNVLIGIAVVALIALVLLRTVYRGHADRAWRAIRRGTRILRSGRYLTRMVTLAVGELGRPVRPRTGTCCSRFGSRRHRGASSTCSAHTSSPRSCRSHRQGLVSNRP